MGAEKSLGSSQSRIFDSLIRDSSFLLAMCSTRFRWLEACDSHRSVPSPAGGGRGSPRAWGGSRPGCASVPATGLSLHPPAPRGARRARASPRPQTAPSGPDPCAGMQPSSDSFSCTTLPGGTRPSTHGAPGPPGQGEGGRWPRWPLWTPRATCSAAPGLGSPVASDGRGWDSTGLASVASRLPSARGSPRSDPMNLDPTRAGPGPWASKHPGPGWIRCKEDLTGAGLPSPGPGVGTGSLSNPCLRLSKTISSEAEAPAQLSSHPTAPQGEERPSQPPSLGCSEQGPEGESANYRGREPEAGSPS